MFVPLLTIRRTNGVTPGAKIGEASKPLSIALPTCQYRIEKAAAKAYAYLSDVLVG